MVFGRDSLNDEGGCIEPEPVGQVWGHAEVQHGSSGVVDGKVLSKFTSNQRDVLGKGQRRCGRYDSNLYAGAVGSTRVGGCQVVTDE